ncbi:pseudouridine synthase [Gayadomonas joobiniege]|uniref:pseudouridine synthase n=1 Tax=Gayadomonas joobiniege TaxID=1234606 RepID=UPI00037D1068|nr:pseudouridine synthase [Gayadomonas joobiniege]
MKPRKPFSGANRAKTTRVKRAEPAQPRLFLFNKPYDVLTQFTDDQNRATLKDYLKIPNIYPAGRLDKDSEGLLMLTDSGQLQHFLSSPKTKQEKVYWVQVEGQPSQQQLVALRQGIELKDGMTKPAKVKTLAEPDLWPRNPPVRARKTVPDSWLEIRITEGKNRQVRRMTAAVGLPTLRLIRVQQAGFELSELAPGEWREVPWADVKQVLAGVNKKRR